MTILVMWARGAQTKLDVSVGGLGGLPVQNPASKVPYPFANTANYGPVQGTTTQIPPVGSSVITGLPIQVVNQITGANFSNNTAGTLVNGPGVPIGTTVLVFDSIHGTVTLSAPITSIAPDGLPNLLLLWPTRRHGDGPWRGPVHEDHRGSRPEHLQRPAQHRSAVECSGDGSGNRPGNPGHGPQSVPAEWRSRG